MLLLRDICGFLLRCLCPAKVGYVVLLSFAASISQAEAVQNVADPFYPKAGTYRLYKVQRAPDGWVIEDSAWSPRRLSSYTTGKITLFSFFYGLCRDPQGCPAAWDAFQKVHDAVKKDPKLHGKVRLVFLSLDPEVDTPQVLSYYRSSLNTPEAPWSFLTTWSESYLAPILNDMYVPASRAFDDSGKPTDVINHMLKVFLIDKDAWVREVYTTAFLEPHVIMDDIRTILLDEK